ncbi:hypothetical protein GGI07_001713, partial [Coemansia sp. Benny D115]
QTPASTATPVAPTAPLNTADRVVSWDKVLRSDSSMDIGNSMHIVSPDDIQRSLRLLAYEMLQQVPATSAPVQDANLHQQPAFNGLPAFSTSVAPSSAYGCPSSDGYLGLNRPDSCSSFDDFFDFLSATESEIDSSELSSPGPETSFPANPVVFADRGNYSSQAAYQGSTPSPLLSSTSSYVRANTAKKSAAEKPRCTSRFSVSSGLRGHYKTYANKKTKKVKSKDKTFIAPKPKVSPPNTMIPAVIYGYAMKNQPVQPVMVIKITGTLQVPAPVQPINQNTDSGVYANADDANSVNNFY